MDDNLEDNLREHANEHEYKPTQKSSARRKRAKNPKYILLALIITLATIGAGEIDHKKHDIPSIVHRILVEWPRYASEISVLLAIGGTNEPNKTPREKISIPPLVSTEEAKSETEPENPPDAKTRNSEDEPRLKPMKVKANKKKHGKKRGKGKK